MSFQSLKELHNQREELRENIRLLQVRNVCVRVAVFDFLGRASDFRLSGLSDEDHQELIDEIRGRLLKKIDDISVEMSKYEVIKKEDPTP